MDTFLESAQTFVDDGKLVGTVSKLPEEDSSTQSFTPSADPNPD